MNQKINHKKPMIPIAINAACHPHCFSIQGTVRGTKIAPIVVPELKMPVAKDLSFLGKYSAVAFIAAGKLPASPMAKTDLAKIKPTTDADIAAMPVQPSTDLMPVPMDTASA